MKINRTFLIVTFNTLALLVVIEVISYMFLRNKGIHSRLFLPLNTAFEGRRAVKFNTIDPHLGFAHDNSGKWVANLSTEFTWKNGFVIYEKDAAEIRKLQRPVILVLGGSTTDGVNFGRSWPEHLARIMRDKGMSGTIVNGGTGGYSTNQELLKLLRDGLEFSPDLVISYSGINDRGYYSTLPHPMVHSHQRMSLETISRGRQSPILPSTIQMLMTVTGIDAKSKNVYTLGIPTERTLSQQYERNMQLMHAISESNGAKFIGFIQPYGYFRNPDGGEPDSEGRNEYRDMVVSLYEEVTHLPKRIEYLRDATHILQNNPEVYKSDRVHLHDEGNNLVAQYVFGEISPLLNSTRQ